MRGACLIAFVLGCGSSVNTVEHPDVSPNDPYLSALTSGSIGCPPAEIAIADYRSVLRIFHGTSEAETATWTAKCRGKQFYCTGSNSTRCLEALPPVVDTSAAIHPVSDNIDTAHEAK